MKIIYLVESKFCKRDYYRFGLEVLLRRGYKNIEVWDLSAWLRVDYFNKYKPKDLMAGENYKSISSSGVAVKLLKSLPDNSLFICILRPSIKNMVIFNYLNKNNIKYGFFSFGYFPVHGKFFRMKQALNDPFLILRRLIDLTLVKIYTLTLSPIKANFLMLGGGVATSNYIDNSTTKLKTHTLDYDLFLTLKDIPRRVKQNKYIVFLDDNGPNHPDDIGRNVAFTTKSYYEILNNFFDNLEMKLGMEIIIAPHPRSNYKSIENPFNGRIISSLSTINTVKDSEIVISHASTAISFAVLYNKPMLFMCNKLYPSYAQEGVKNMAAFFNKRTIDISTLDFVIQDSDLATDYDVYNSYKELYIKESGTPEKPTWDIFADYLDTI